MNVQRTATAAFTATFDSEQELREEHRTNLAFGALRLPTSESVAVDTALLITLRGASGGEMIVRAKVVAALPDGLALAIDANADDILSRLVVVDNEPPAESTQTSWDRVRSLSQMEKILLASKADRMERSLLIQDNDPRVLLSVLRNPRLTVDEVARIAKSPFLTYQIADVIMKTTPWIASLDVRLGLIHNPKTPPAMSLRMLPTLPDADVRAIARSGTNMQLKQAALRKLQGR